MLFSDIPSDVASKILSFCSCGDLLTLRRTSRSMFPVNLDREFRLRVPIDILKLTACIQDVHMYVRLLHHTMEHSRPLICKTAGSKLFRLRAQDLEGLDRTFKRNARYWGADDMELFSRVDLFVAALKRHGSVAQLRAYDATIKQRTFAQRAKKKEVLEQAMIKRKALVEQFIVQREPFLTQIDEAYKQYLDKTCEDDPYKHDNYIEFRENNIAEYRSAFCKNDRDEYECYVRDVDERNKRALRKYYAKKHEAQVNKPNLIALQDWQPKSRCSDTNTRGKKRKATTSDTYCISCLKNLAAMQCTNTCCGLCCGTHESACIRHKNQSSSINK